MEKKRGCHREKGEFSPLILREALADCGISLAKFCTEANRAGRAKDNKGRTWATNKSGLSLLISKGAVPRKISIAELEKWLRDGIKEFPKLIQWAKQKKCGVRGLLRNTSELHFGSTARIDGGLPHRKDTYNGQHFLNMEPKMLGENILNHFRLNANPFNDSLLDADSLWLSHSMENALDAMKSAARTGGMLGVISEVGSGKTIVRLKLYKDLERDASVQLVTVKIVDKKKCTPSHVCHAITRDLTANETPKSDREAAARQVERLLKERVNQGIRPVIVFEEGHDLGDGILRYLKRFHEIKEGFRPLCSIILIAQPELGDKITESRAYDIREFSRRLERVEIAPLNGQMEDYLSFRFGLVGAKLSQVFADGALKEIRKALKHQLMGTRKVESKNYPLSVNNIVKACMFYAHQGGMKKVTPDVVFEVQKDTPKW